MFFNCKLLLVGMVKYCMLMMLKQKKNKLPVVQLILFLSSGAVMYANEFETKKTTKIEIK